MKKFPTFSPPHLGSQALKEKGDFSVSGLLNLWGRIYGGWVGVWLGIPTSHWTSGAELVKANRPLGPDRFLSKVKFNETSRPPRAVPTQLT